MFEVDSDSSEDRLTSRSEGSGGAAASDSDDMLSGFDDRALRRIRKLKRRAKSVINTNRVDVKQYLE